MATLEDVTFVKEALRTVAQVTRTTYDVLAQAVHQPERRPPPQQLGRFSATLEHIGDIREGFILSQRATARSDRAELRYLVQQVLIDWQWLEAMGMSLKPGERIETLAGQLIAYQHTLTVLGILPHLPAEAITFPQFRPTYVDVRPPRRPSQMLDRIEEIEQTLYRASLVPLEELTFDTVRRTYAFFEASVWVVNRYLAGLIADK